MSAISPSEPAFQPFSCSRCAAPATHVLVDQDRVPVPNPAEQEGVTLLCPECVGRELAQDSLEECQVCKTARYKVAIHSNPAPHVNLTREFQVIYDSVDLVDGCCGEHP